MEGIAIDRDRGFARSLPALLALALATTLGFAMLGSFSTVQEAAKAEMGLSDYGLSLVQGVAVAVPLLLLSVPIGLAVDRLNRVRLLILLGVVWTAGTLLTAVAGNLTTLFVARMMTAVGMSGTLTAALSLAADLCAPAQRGRATLIVTLGKTAGQAAGFALTGALVTLLSGYSGLSPWRATHFALAGISALLIVPLFFLREPARREREAAASAPFRVVAGELWARRAWLGPMFIGQVSVVMADASAVIWAAPVLSRNYGLQPAAFGSWLGAIVLASGILGSVIGGFAADAGQRSGRRGGLLLGAVIAAGVGIPAALFPLSPSVPTFAVAMGVLVLSGTVTGLVMSVALTVLLPNELRGLCIGAFIAVAGLIGFGVAPTLVAAVSDWLGGEAHLGQALALVGTVVGIGGLAGFWTAMRRSA